MAKILLIEEWEARIEPTLEEQFEEALAREDARDHRGETRIPKRQERIRLVVDNGR